MRPGFLFPENTRYNKPSPKKGMTEWKFLILTCFHSVILFFIIILFFLHFFLYYKYENSEKNPVLGQGKNFAQGTENYPERTCRSNRSEIQYPEILALLRLLPGCTNRMRHRTCIGGFCGTSSASAGEKVIKDPAFVAGSTLSSFGMAGFLFYFFLINCIIYNTL